ncbi:acyl-CoA dehydratase activase [Atopobiaceae bacterium HCP3S3_F7]
MTPSTSTTSTTTTAGAKPRTVFYACKYTPVELLAGFGSQARLAEADVASFDHADALAHPNLCGYGKGLIERLLAPDVHEVVLVTCCDVIKRCYDVLRRQGKLDFVYLLDLPHKCGEAERRLFRARLAGLAEAYAAYSGETFDVGRALAACRPPVPRTDERVTLLGAHATSALLRTVSRDVGIAVENATCTNRQLLVSPPPQLARVAAAGDCEACEAPAAPGQVDVGRTGGTLDTFLDWYAEALLDQMPCMRMDDVSQRKALRDERGELGVVYHTMKFCDYYGFEYAEATQDGGTPMVKIETDGTSQSAGQLKTRLAAFGETLRGVSRARSAAGERRERGGAKDGASYVLGIDSGSTSTDAVVMDAERNLVATVILPTGAKATEAAARARQEVLERAHLGEEDLALEVSTGYGREAIPGMDASITEITCHARGAHYLMPEVKTVIDIGGQDSKVIHLDEAGDIINFVMNDKCAAGTGRFLEMMARTLEMPLADFCAKGLEWKHDVKISSMCTVFAESEVVSLVANDTPTPDIIHGLDESVARKTATLAKRVSAEPPYLMTGGVANNEGVVKALEAVLGAPVATHPDSQLCGAIGAALLGLESLA